MKKRARFSAATVQGEESGSMLSLLAVILPAFLGVVALSTDMGYARWTRSHLRTAADAATLAGAGEIIEGRTAAQITAEAAQIFSANAPGATLVSVETGEWSGGVFTAGAPSINAVRVVAQSSTPTYLARIFGAFSVTERVSSVAAAAQASRATCAIPFGIVDSVVQSLRYGDIVDINRVSPGNWGKLDIGGNMSSAPNFIDAMTTGRCAQALPVGQPVSQGTGVAGLVDGFEARMAINPEVIIPVVTPFNNGNATVTVVGFVRARLIPGPSGKNGGWKGQLQIVVGEGGDSIGPTSPGQPYAWARDLVQ